MSYRRDPKREVYQTPMLSILGDIREVTKTTNNNNESLDGGSMMNSKTTGL